MMVEVVAKCGLLVEDEYRNKTSGASPPLSGSIPHTHSHTCTHGVLVFCLGAAPLPHGTQLKSKVNSNRAERQSERQAGSAEAVTRGRGGSCPCRRTGCSGSLPYPFCSPLLYSRTVRRGEAVRLHCCCCCCSRLRGGQPRGGRRGGGGVVNRRRGERNTHIHTYAYALAETDSASTSFFP